MNSFALRHREIYNNNNIYLTSIGLSPGGSEIW